MTGGDTFATYKLVVYLQPHATTGGLTVVNGSHLQPGQQPLSAASAGVATTHHVSTLVGDVVLFDVRLVHSGGYPADSSDTRSDASAPRGYWMATVQPRDNQHSRERRRLDFAAVHVKAMAAGGDARTAVESFAPPRTVSECLLGIGWGASQPPPQHELEATARALSQSLRENAMAGGKAAATTRRRAGAAGSCELRPS